MSRWSLTPKWAGDHVRRNRRTSGSRCATPPTILTEYYPMGAPNRCVSLHSHHDGSWQRGTATQVAVGRRPGAGVPCSAPRRGRTRDVRRGARRRRRSRSGSRTLPTAAGRSRRSHGLAVRVERWRYRPSVDDTSRHCAGSIGSGRNWTACAPPVLAVRKSSSCCEKASPNSGPRTQPSGHGLP